MQIHKGVKKGSEIRAINVYLFGAAIMAIESIVDAQSVANSLRSKYKELPLYPSVNYLANLLVALQASSDLKLTDSVKQYVDILFEVSDLGNVIGWIEYIGLQYFDLLAKKIQQTSSCTKDQSYKIPEISYWKTTAILVGVLDYFNEKKKQSIFYPTYKTKQKNIYLQALHECLKHLGVDQDKKAYMPALINFYNSLLHTEKGAILQNTYQSRISQLTLAFSLGQKENSTNILLKSPPQPRTSSSDKLPLLRKRLPNDSNSTASGSESACDKNNKANSDCSIM